MTEEYYIGLMSGTSLDGIDAGLYRFSDQQAQVIDFYYQPYPAQIKQKIRELCNTQQTISLPEYGELDTQLGKLYAEACLNLLKQTAISTASIKAIGSHGQTLCHAPNMTHPFTLQIGDPNIISYLTGITTVSDFRRKDIAAGGQGAPLVPSFHHAMFHSAAENRAIVNIGGIANLTILPQELSKKNILGFDTGPGNTLMDYWISQHKNKILDEKGQWAATGTIQTELLNNLKDESFFSAAPPKSTGTEYFSPTWLNQKLAALAVYSPEDVQRTLCQLTAETIAEAIKIAAPKTDKVFICGGGAHNQTLLMTLKDLLQMPVLSTETEGIHPDQVEAMAFAWLAKRTLHHLSGNIPEATGAKQAVILGGIYQP